MKAAMPQVPHAGELVLLGGGHAHVEVVRQWMMQPEPDLRLTLVSDEALAPYSGMLPGCIAGYYSYAEICVDLPGLCERAGVRFLQAEVTALDTARRRIELRDRPDIGYELLSLNLGSTPGRADIPGAAQCGIGIKPVSEFIRALPALLERLREVDGGGRLAVVGGGVGGVELLLALARRLRVEAVGGGTLPELLLLHPPEQLLAALAPVARQRLVQALDDAGVTRIAMRVERAEAGVLRGEGSEVAVDAVIWTTPGVAPPWLAGSGLALDRGFVAVDRTLRSSDLPNVFAAGDCARIRSRPLPRSGVYAVRAGPVLAANLRRAWRGRRLRRWRPQQQTLALIGLGEPSAVANRGRWAASGAWVWRWKQHIDRRFMARYHPHPLAPPKLPVQSRPFAATPPAQLAGMRCNGCGAKLGSDVLYGALAELARRSGPGGAAPDAGGPPEDAVRVALGDEPGTAAYVSVDGFRSFCSDPYLFGRIAANHAFNDLWAMGLAPRAVSTLAMVPHGADRLMQDDLLQLLAGVERQTRRAGARLAGGHSAEAAELAIGLTVLGAAGARVWHKSGLHPGALLILTKPLGSGALLVGRSQGRAEAAALEALQASQLLGHEVAPLLCDAGRVRAATDVSGFGLAGHALEMARASGCDFELACDRWPIYAGALDCMAQGAVSSLQPANERAVADHVDVPADLSAMFRLSCDPQTAGGLLLGVDPAHAATVLQTLSAAGLTASRVIGRVVASAVSAGTSGVGRLRLVHDFDPDGCTAVDAVAGSAARADR